MSINLGLERITRVLGALKNPQNSFKALHVAGTNGKGSVCAYLSSVLNTAHRSVGRFNSPHLIHPWNSIYIREKPLPSIEYKTVQKMVDDAALDAGVTDCTPFERQTAIAFLAFQRAKLDYAVVEVGLGGRDDATNVMGNVIGTAITKIALDHQSFLGSSLSSIASHKAGIMKPGIPCVVDGSNDLETLQEIDKEAVRLHANVIVADKSMLPSGLQIMPGEFQKANASVAYKLLTEVFSDISSKEIKDGFSSTRWPGRLQFITPNLIVDGAHNPSAAVELRKFIDSKFPNQPVHWIVAFSKPCDDILPLLIRDKDTVTATEFGAVQDMPWISAQSSDEIAKVAKQHGVKDLNQSPSIEQIDIDGTRPTVVCGSLYLVGEFLKLHI